MGSPSHDASTRVPAVLRVLGLILVAFSAFAAVANAAVPAAAAQVLSSPVEIQVDEENPYGGVNPYAAAFGCWTVIFTSTVDPAVQYVSTNVCTNDVERLVYTDPVPDGEYRVEVIDPTGEYSVTLHPECGCDPTSPVYISGGATLYFLATQHTVGGSQYTPAGSGVVVDYFLPGATVTFGTVTQEGTTTVERTDIAPALPEGYLQVGAYFYEVSTTAVFDSATLCFSYDPTTVDGSTLSLLHYENGAWVDVMTSNDTVNGVICGSVTSFSPFAVVSAPVIWSITGFHAPVDMTSGLVNTVKGGSAVPLKFNVYQDDVEVTDPAAVVVSIVEVACSGGATDSVDGAFETEAGTGLTYSGTAGVDGQFIQVWKTPKVAATTCYQATASLANGTAITALFQLNP